MIGSLYKAWYTHCVGGSREWCPLDWRPLVRPVVPENDLTRVRPTNDEVRVEFGKACRHHR